MSDSTASNLATNIRQLREERGLTQQHLAKLSGVPRPTIANLESGEANPTISVLVKIAATLRVSIETLIGQPREDARLYRAGKLPVRQRGGATVRKLLPDAIPAMDFGRIEIPAGVRMASSPHTHGTREYLLCEAGEIEVSTAGRTFVLQAGDVLSFRGDQRHAYLNRARKTAVAYSVVVLAPVIG